MRRKTKWIIWGLVGGLIALALLAAGAGAIYQQRATSRDLAATPPPGQLVNVGGHRLHLWCMGSGSPTVILESGLGGSAFTWARVQPRVARFTRVCSYDRAGLGYSDEGPAPRTSGRIADELGRLLDSAGIEQPVVLVASSLGGFSARILASTQPRRVGALVLVDASHEDQQRRLAAAGLLPRNPPGLWLAVRAASFGVLRLRGETLGLDPETADPSVRPFVRATVHRASRYRTLYSEAMAWEESAQEVKASRRKLDIPVLVLSAGSWPADGRQIHADLQRDQVTLSSRGCQMIAERAGHDIVEDAPKLVVQAIRRVIDAVRANSKTLDC